MSLSSKSVSNSILSSLESIKTEVQFPCEERRFILLCHIQLETSHEVKPSPKADQINPFCYQTYSIPHESNICKIKMILRKKSLKLRAFQHLHE